MKRKRGGKPSPKAPIGASEAEAVCEQYKRMVWRIAIGISKTSLGQTLGTVDDLFQVGMIGLLHAARLYDSTKGTKFLTYAYTCVSRWIRQECRRLGGIIHVPDDRKAGDTEAARVARGVGIVPDFYDKATTDDDVLLRAEQEDDLVLIRRMLRRLPARHAIAVRYRYFEGLTFEEVGIRLGISKQRAGEMIRQALARLKSLVEHSNDAPNGAREKV